MSIYSKLFECKKEIGKISKDSTNPFFKSKYFDVNALLEHVEPILQKHNLLLLQPIVEGDVCSIIIDVETGEKEESKMSLTDINDPQKRGSEITYYRRYTLQSLLGLQAEDDDANKASGKSSASNQSGATSGSDTSGNPTKWLNKTVSKDSSETTKEWDNIVSGIEKGTVNSVQDVRKHYKVSKAIQAELDLVLIQNKK